MATKTYTITKENRVTNSPFTIEGSNIKIDITHDFPVPSETVCIDSSGAQREIRFIMGCKTIFKDEQIEMGYPAYRKPTAQERSMLTFLGGMLTIPEGYSNLEKYLEMAPWFVEPDEEDERNKKRPPNSRRIYEVYDQEAIDDENLEFEDFVTEARALISKSDKETLLDLLRLSRPGFAVDLNISVKQLKLQLLEMANTNPDFILKNAKLVSNDKLVLISKALDYGVLNIDSPGKVLMQSGPNKKLKELTRIPDFGGRSVKIDRLSAYFDSDEGKLVLKEVAKLCTQFENEHNLMDDDDEPTTQPTTTAAPTTTTTTAATTTTTTTVAEETTTTTTEGTSTTTTTVKRR